MRHKTPKTSSIEKALMIIMAFTSHSDEMGTVELSQKLGFHPATVSRILQILRKKGFLQNNKRTRKFTLGPSAFELGKTIFRSVNPNLLNIAMPYLVDLCEEVGETVVLETISGKKYRSELHCSRKALLKCQTQYRGQSPRPCVARSESHLCFF